MSINWDDDLLAEEEALAEGAAVSTPAAAPGGAGSSSAPRGGSEPIDPEVGREASPEVEIVSEVAPGPEIAIGEVGGDVSDLETLAARKKKRRAEKRPEGSRPSKRPVSSRAHTMALPEDLVSSLPSPLRVFHEQVTSGYDMQAWRRSTRIDPIGSAEESVTQAGQSLVSLLGSLSSIKRVFDETATIVATSQEKTVKLEAAERELAEAVEAKARVEAELAQHKEGVLFIREELKVQQEKIDKFGADCAGLLRDKGELLAKLQAREGELSEVVAKNAALESTVEALTTGLATSPAYIAGMKGARAVGRDQAGTILVKMIKDKYPDLDLDFLYAPRG